MRLGYFPLHHREAQRMRRFLQFPNEPASALDPCSGTGAALVTITENSASRRYGIELDSHRAVEARKTLDEVIQGNAFDAKAPVESFSLLYLNPPYDFEVGEGKNNGWRSCFWKSSSAGSSPGAYSRW
jgi:tRNA1(Val) A37 N6-methylase TrmN6